MNKGQQTQHDVSRHLCTGDTKKPSFENQSQLHNLSNQYYVFNYTTRHVTANFRKIQYTYNFFMFLAALCYLTKCMYVSISETTFGNASKK